MREQKLVQAIEEALKVFDPDRTFEENAVFTDNSEWEAWALITVNGNAHVDHIEINAIFGDDGRIEFECCSFKKVYSPTMYEWVDEGKYRRIYRTAKGAGNYVNTHTNDAKLIPA